MKRRTQASLQYFKALRQRSQNHIQRPWMRSSSVKSYNIHSELTNTYLANTLNQYASLQPKDLQPINLSFDLNGQQKSAKGKAPQQPDRDFEACARLNERKSEERNPRHSGNCYMLTNGVWSYSWDAENRLAAVYSNNTLLVSNFYDHQSRRIRKTVFASSDLGSSTSDLRFTYDGWNLIQETIHNSQLTITNSYTWGLDLSGDLQGAGGVGGLLAVHRDSAAFFPCFDANGNVTEYVDASGTIRAHYAFDAFGNTISQSGDLASTFSFRFSTKYFDPETRLYYYGYRYYSPELGRWANRDPIEEMGGMNVYGFVGNDGADGVDKYGLWMIKHNSSMPVATATREEGDSLLGLAKKTGFSSTEIMDWARQNNKGEKFGTVEDAESACEVYIPNRILLMLPTFREPGIKEYISPYFAARYAIQFDGWLRLREKLSSVAEKYKTAGFMIDRLDYIRYGRGHLGLTESHTRWNLMGLVIGGHGNPPLPFIPTPPGCIEIDPDSDLIKPLDFINQDRNYRLPSLLVFGCYVGMNTWRDLAVPNSPFVYVSPSRPTVMWDFPDSFGVPSW